MNRQSVKSTVIIPKNELWIHRPKASLDFQRAINWASRNLLGKKLKNTYKRKRSAR